MKYILDESELDNLCERVELDKRDTALEKARLLILKLSGFECANFCFQCPIGDIMDGDLSYEESTLICREKRNYPK